MTGWDHLFDLEVEKIVVSNTPDPVGKSVKTSVVSAIIGTSRFPHSRMGESGLECACNRSPDLARGCIVCWFVSVWKARPSSSAMDSLWLDFLSSRSDEFVQIYRSGLALRRAVDVFSGHTGSLDSEDSHMCAIDAMRAVDEDASLLESILRDRIESLRLFSEDWARFHEYHGKEEREPVDMPQDPLDHISHVPHPAGDTVLDRIVLEAQTDAKFERPKAIEMSARTAHATPRLEDSFPSPAPNMIKEIFSVDSIDLPVTCILDSIRNRFRTYVDNLGKETLDPHFATEIDNTHKDLLIHSREVSESICASIDEYLSCESEDLVLCGSIHVSSLERSCDIFHLLESAEVPERLYKDAFKLMVAVEYCMHSLDRSWKLLSMWKDGLRIWALWRVLRWHICSIYQHLKVDVVEGNRKMLFEELKRAKSRSDQGRMHLEFLNRIEKDMFLRESGKVYRDKIVELCAIGVRFRTIVERCYAFQRDQEDVLFELEGLHVEDITGFLRIHLEIF